MSLKNNFQIFFSVISNIIFSLSMIAFSLLNFLITDDFTYNFKTMEACLCSVFFFFLGIIFFIATIQSLKNKKSLIRNFQSQYKVDLEAFSLFSKHLPVTILFIVFNLAVVVLAKYEYSHLVLKAYLAQYGVLAYWKYLFCIIFIIFSLYGLSYCIVGEYFQSKFGKRKRIIFFDLLVDLIFMLPFIALLSGIALLFVLVKNKSASKVIFRQFITFKYMTYFFMALIAYEDSRYMNAINGADMRNKANWMTMNYIESNKGAIFLSFLFALGMVFTYNMIYNFISIEKMIYVTTIGAVLYVIYCLMCEQIVFYKYYLKNKKIKL